MRTERFLCLLASAMVIAAAAAPASANVFASGLQKTSQNSFSYILNENADLGVTVQVWENGGGKVYEQSLGALSKGAHNWAWDGTGITAGKTYTAKIVASSSGYSGWTQISTDNTSTSFYVPVGVSVYNSQNSANFGKIYISNAKAGTTAFGRATSDGIYMLNADGSDAGYATGGKNWVTAGDNSPFKSTIGPDGHLYVSDYSNDLVWEFNDDLSAATQLINASNKTTGQYVESIYVEGTQAAGNRRIYVVDSDYNDARRGLIRYDLGSAGAAASGDTGTQVIGPDYFGFYPRDVARDSKGNWYMNQFRSDATQAPAISKFMNSSTLPINTAAWETLKQAPYGGAYGIDIFEPKGWVAYGNYYTGEVFVFSMVDGSFITSFDAGTRLREVAFDAAGNIITVDNMTEWARIWSPGDGSNSFTTGAWFNIVPEPSSLFALVTGLAGLAGLRRRSR